MGVKLAEGLKKKAGVNYPNLTVDQLKTFHERAKAIILELEATRDFAWELGQAGIVKAESDVRWDESCIDKTSHLLDEFRDIVTELAFAIEKQEAKQCGKKNNQ